MSVSTHDPKKAGWFGGLVDGAARAFAFGAGSRRGRHGVLALGSEKGGRSEKAAGSGKPAGKSAAPEKPVRQIRMKGLTLQVHRLAADGHARAEIARRTALSQDTVALLLHLAPEAPDESAGRGSFFRAGRGEAGLSRSR